MDLKNYFINRATVRSYKPEQVPDEVIDDIILRASKAPTTGNMQLYSVIVSSTPEEKKALAPCHFNQPMVEGCSHLLTVCADFGRFTRWCELGHADAGFDNMLSFVSAMTDAVILSQQIITIAETEGLGTCWLGTVTYNAAKIAEILHLPELVVPVACISTGYPAAPGEPTERLPLESIRYKSRYPELTDVQVKEMYRAKDEYPINAGYVKENNKENLAQVFAEVRYPRAMNEEFSKGFIEFLRKQKFLK